MTEEITLKPCPFCGGEAEIIDDAMGTVPRCRCCGAANGNGVYGAEGHKLAVKDWNRRPIEDALRAENERLREALNATQTILNTVDLSRLEHQDRSKFYDVVFIDGIIDKALKGGNE